RAPAQRPRDHPPRAPVLRRGGHRAARAAARPPDRRGLRGRARGPGARTHPRPAPADRPPRRLAGRAARRRPRAHRPGRRRPPAPRTGPRDRAGDPALRRPRLRHDPRPRRGHGPVRRRPAPGGPGGGPHRLPRQVGPLPQAPRRGRAPCGRGRLHHLSHRPARPDRQVPGRHRRLGRRRAPGPDLPRVAGPPPRHLRLPAQATGPGRWTRAHTVLDEERPMRKRAVTTAARPEDERLPLGRSFMYGLQHVLTMYGGIIAVPLIVGQAAGLSDSDVAVLIASALFVGGAATVLQSCGVPFFGSQLPLVQGVSFAGVATMLAILAGSGGLPAVMGAVLVAGAFGLVAAPFFAQIIRFFPPVVTGVVITTIGLTLMPVAAGWAMGGQGSEDFGSTANIGLAFLTFVIVLVLSKVGVATISRLSILLSIIIGTLVAAVLGMADFSGVGEGPTIAVPAIFAFGTPTFEVAAIISMIIVVLVTMTETTADILAVGEIVRTKIDSKRIADGLRADMLSSTVAPVFNSFTQTAF